MKGGFLSVNFHRNTVERFKGFCKKTGASYTDTLEHMMDFFDTYQLSPLENFGPTVRGMEANIKKRINSMIGIIKDIEKHQTKPTTAMLELLFEKSPQKKRGQAPLLMGGQSNNPERDMFFKKVEEAIEIEKEFTNLKRDLRHKRAEFIALVSKVHLVKSGFGKQRLQLDMTPEDFEKLKIKLEKE
jgi:hypothetical protein